MLVVVLRLVVCVVAVVVCVPVCVAGDAVAFAVVVVICAVICVVCFDVVVLPAVCVVVTVYVLPMWYVWWWFQPSAFPLCRLSHASLLYWFVLYRLLQKWFPQMPLYWSVS